MSLDNFRLFHVLPGNLLVIPDPDQTSKGSIYFPDNMHAKAESSISTTSKDSGSSSKSGRGEN
jgi:hypothetical protein